MDQIQNKDPFFSMGLENDVSALPVFDDGSKSESSDFCIDTSDVEFTVDPATEDICVDISSDHSGLVREPSAHASAAEISHNSNVRADEQPRDVTGSAELLGDVWDNLAYDGSIVSFECDQDSWKLENFDDEQFDCLMSQYVPAVRDGDASAGKLMTAETHDNGSNSLCLSGMKTEELNEISGTNSGANTSGGDELGAARTSGDKNLAAHQRSSTFSGVGCLETGTLAADLNSMREVGITFEEQNSVDEWIQHARVNRNSDSGCLTSEIVMDTASCEHQQVMGGDDQDELSLREALLSGADNTCLICDDDTETKILVCDTETKILLCDEQSDCPSSGADLTQNEKCEHRSNMLSDKEYQSKNTTDTTETNLVCGEQFRSSNSAHSGSDITWNEKFNHNYNLATGNKENQSEIVANSTEADLFCEEPFESGDGNVSNVIQNENVRHINNKNQSKNIDDVTDHDATGIVCCSSLTDWDKNDEILSCESDEKETLDPVLQSILNSDLVNKGVVALCASELTSSGTARLKPDVATEQTSQTAVAVDNTDSSIEIIGAAFSSDNPRPVSSHSSDLLSLAVGSKDLPKNCEPLLSELSNPEEVGDSDTSVEEVLLLEYANQEETGDDANKDKMPNEEMKKLSAETSKDEEILQSGSNTGCWGLTPLSADAALSVTDSNEVPSCGSTIVHGELPTDNGDLEVEDLVVSVATGQTNEETSTEVESTGLALEDKDILRTDEKDSFDEVHRNNEDGLASEDVTAAESESNVIHKSTKSDECGSSDNNDTLAPKKGHGDNLIIVDEKEDSPPPTDGDIDSVVKSMKKEKPWTFGDEASGGDDSWKDPVPHGLKECFCPHGLVSVQAGHYHCQECGFPSIYKISIMRHEVMMHRVKHTAIKIMQCRLCPSFFIHVGKFRRHSKKHAHDAISSFKGEKHPSSDSETPPRLDSSVAPSSESSPTRSNSVPPPRSRRMSAGWNWKVAFDFQSLMEQRAKKRKSDRQTTEEESSVVNEKPDESSRSKLVKLNNKTDVGVEKQAETGYYNVTEVSAEGVQTTFKLPCYDGVLLSSLMEPSNTCPICYRKFSKMTVQKSHYAQVHRICLQGVTIHQCKPCGVRCVSSHDFEAHVRRARHRIVVDCLKEPGSADTISVAGIAPSLAVDTCSSAVDRYRGSTRKRRRSNGVVGEEFPLLKKVMYNDDNEKISSLEVRNNREGLRGAARQDEGSRSKKVVNEKSMKKIKWFYGSVTRNGGRSPEIHLNACVSNHVCTSACVCGLTAKDEMPSRTIHKKKKKKKMVPVEERSDGIESAPPSELFQPVIVDSFSCLPSMWTSISDITSDENRTADDKASKDLQTEKKSCRTEPYKEPPSQFASNTTKAIKFFQNTQRTIFTASLQNTLKPPQQTVTQIKPRSQVALKSTSTVFTDSLQNTLKSQQTAPQIKPRSQVALKSTSQQTSRRLKDTREENTSRSHKPRNKDDSHDVDNTIIIHLSDDDDDGSDSSNSATVAPDLVSCKTEAAMVRPNSAAGCSNQVHKTLDCVDFNSAHVVQPVDTSICKRSENRRRVSTLSTSQAADVAPAGKGVLSEFRSDVLCDELQKRGFMRRCACGVFFLGLPTYNIHCAWHSSGSPLRCSVCKAVTKDWYEFYSHIQNHCK